MKPFFIVILAILVILVLLVVGNAIYAALERKDAISTALLG